MQTEILFPFTKAAIAENASCSGGVYTLYNEKKEVIYYGKASRQPIAERLMQHTSPESECLRSVHYFTFETTNNPDKRYGQLVRKFQSTHGRLPECNERMERSAVNAAKGLASAGVLTNAFIG